MEEIKSKNTIRKVKNGLSHIGKVNLTLLLTDNGILEIEENYQNEVPNKISQGQIESISKKGYDDWKKGIIKGIEYAYKKLLNNNGLKVIIESAEGLSTDTNPTIIGFSASRAILEKLPNSENKNELEQLEQIVYSSWCFKYDAIPDFKNKKIIGEKVKSNYRNDIDLHHKSQKKLKTSFWNKIKSIWK